MVAHAFNPNSGRQISEFRDQPDLKSKFQDNQSYTEKPHVNKPKPNQTNLTNKSYSLKATTAM